MNVGDEVGWKWAGSVATGVIAEMYTTRHEIISKGKHIVRNGSLADPALVIKHSSGTLVLKLQHEVQQITQES